MPLLRRWFSLLSVGWNSGNIPKGIAQSGTQTSEAGNQGSTAVAFTNPVKIGQVVVIAVAYGSLNSNDFDTGCTDNLGNSYTRQEQNGQHTSAPSFHTVIWSAPVTVAGSCTVTLTFNLSTTEFATCAYVLNAVNATPIAKAGNGAITVAGGYTTTTTGAITISNVSAAYGASGVEANPTFSGNLDIANSLSTVNELGVGHGSGSWTITDAAHFAGGCASECSFS